MSSSSRNCRPVVFVHAKAVQDRLGSNFYAFVDTYPVLIQNGLLMQFDHELGFTGILQSTGFRKGIDFGVGCAQTDPFVPCEGVSYCSFGQACQGLRSTELWTEDMLPEPVRSARERVQSARQLAHEQLEQAKLAHVCALAGSDGVPEHLVSWARLLPHALAEINELRQSVLRLRAAGIPEARLSEALDSPRFLQELFTLKREFGILERPMPSVRWPL